MRYAAEQVPVLVQKALDEATENEFAETTYQEERRIAGAVLDRLAHIFNLNVS